MESILESYLNDFSTIFKFENEDQTKTFEHFVNYTSIPKVENTRDSIEKVNVGGDNNPGIDGLAISVNDHIVTTKEEVDYFLNALGRLEVEFYFTQAKTSNSFSMESISSFVNCIKDFFNSKTTFRFNDETLRLFELKEYIFTKTLQMHKNPELFIIYATTGQWLNDCNVSAMKEISCKELNNTGIFSFIDFKPFDRDQLKKSYRELRNSITRTVNFEQHTILPTIPEVSEAFIGMLPSDEFLKLVCNDQDEMMRNIFYDNVRDFQGFNSVNNEIKNTLIESDDNQTFPLLNNGVTIVAKNISKTGTKFTLSDYQIVNGCQTSHVLFYNRKILNSSIFIPVKIIVTQNYDLMSKIIRANNRQTTVGNEAFEILSPFHKYLEEYYLANATKYEIELYYERRSNQYEPMNLKRTNYITLSNQIKSFIAMFFNEPNTASQRYFGELLKLYKSKIFLEEHNGAAYFISGLCVNKLERMFIDKLIEKRFKRFKYHLLMLLRIEILGSKINPFNSSKIEKQCTDFVKIIKNDQQFYSFVGKTCNKIDDVLKSYPNFRNAHGSTGFRDLLLPGKNATNLTIGKVNYYNTERGFGYLDFGGNNDIWFHISDYHAHMLGEPQIGEELKFEIVDNEKGFRAINISQKG